MSGIRKFFVIKNVIVFHLLAVFLLLSVSAVQALSFVEKSSGFDDQGLERKRLACNERESAKTEFNLTTSLNKHGCAAYATLASEKRPTLQSLDQQNLRVMTFNTRYNEPRDGVNAWANRKTKVAGVIRFHKADLVGVQEAQNNQLKDLETLLPDFAWCGVGRDGEDKGEYSAILYRKERFRLLETKTFWLSETPEKAGSKGWDASYPRIVTWAKFRDKRTKKNFFLFNTHFDHRGERARIESARMLVSKIEKIAGNLPFVVTGDFNARESTDVYKILTGKTENGNTNLKDARYASVNEHFGPTSTFNEFKELIPEMKIDYIFVSSGVKVLEHAVLADRWDGLWASDHLPVLGEISLR